jgi:hypothetical protein
MKIYFHVDVDSPAVLAKFYGIENLQYDESKLESFYQTAFNRSDSFFKSMGVKATYFCVGNELNNKTNASVIKNSFDSGNGIANHTYNHPFGLCELSNEKIKEEISSCDKTLTTIIGKKPVGFRTPGYAVNTQIINTLEELGYKYDSSAGWPLMHAAIKATALLKPITGNKMQIGFGETNSAFKNDAYTPSVKNWKTNSKTERSIRELPLPHAFSVLPLYNNIFLGLSEGRKKLLINNSSSKCFVFLFHSIEFCSSADDFIPKEIYKHPHVTKSVDEKLNSMKQSVELLLKKYSPGLTEDDLA